MDIDTEGLHAGGGYRLEEGTAAGELALTAWGATAAEALQAALAGVLAAMGAASRTVADESAAVAVPIRGSGPDLGELFADLVDDLLAQAESAPKAVARIRLDGLIRTDEGLTAWGYTLRADGPASAGGVALVGAPEGANVNGRFVLRCTLRQRLREL